MEHPFHACLSHAAVAKGIVHHHGLIGWKRKLTITLESVGDNSLSISQISAELGSSQFQDACIVKPRVIIPEWGGGPDGSSRRKIRAPLLCAAPVCEGPIWPPMSPVEAGSPGQPTAVCPAHASPRAAGRQLHAGADTPSNSDIS